MGNSIGKNRNGTKFTAIEISKLVASFGIVWFHVGETTSTAAYASLPYFLLLSIILTRKSHEDKAPWLQNKTLVHARRFLLPWLIWSTIYGAAKSAESIAGNKFLFEWFSPNMLLYGSSIHLWYLPFAFTCMLLVQFIDYERILDRGILQKYSPLFLTALLLLISVRIRFSAPPLPQWFFILPIAAISITTRELFQSQSPHKFTYSAAAISLIFLLLYFSGFNNCAAYSFAFLVISIVFSIHHQSRFDITPVVFFVYLAHPLVAAVISRILNLPARSNILALITFVVSIAFGLFFYKTRPFMLQFWNTKQSNKISKPIEA